MSRAWKKHGQPLIPVREYAALLLADGMMFLTTVHDGITRFRSRQRGQLLAGPGFEACFGGY